MMINSDPKFILVDAYVGNFPSLGPAYVAGYLRAKGGFNNIKILQKKFCPDLVSAIIEEKPDIVGYFSITPGFNHLQEIIQQVKIKKPNLVQIIGGPHFTALPHKLPKEIEVGVISEGEETVLEIMNLFKNYGSLPPDELRSIKGIVYRDGEELIRTERREGIKNLDEIPFPARDLLNIKGYYPVDFRCFPTKIFRSSGLMTSRGCPWHCVFCQENVLSNFRAHSAERTVAEMEELINKYDVNFIQILDDQFLVSQERLEKIADLVIKKKIHKKVSFFCYLRANQVTPQSIKLLKAMNFRVVLIGFESGSDRILKYLKDQTCSVEKNQIAYDLCRQNGIHVYGTFMTGAPPETMADLQQTYNFIKKNHMASAGFFILTPLPGTKIWDYAKARGLVSEDMDWDKLLIKMSSNSRDKIWLSESLDHEEFFKFYDAKISPLLWHYIQVANDFSITDLFKIDFWRLFFKRPKFYLSVLKQSIIHIFKCH